MRDACPPQDFSVDDGGCCPTNDTKDKDYGITSSMLVVQLPTAEDTMVAAGR